MNSFATVIFVCLLAYSWISKNNVMLFGVFFVCLARLLYHYYRSLKVPIEGKAVLITGCASGFGHKLTVKLHSLGFIIFACCLNDQSDGAQELKKLGSTTGRIHVLKMDVTNQKEVDEAVKYVTEHLPQSGLWGLVNNAGRSYVSFIEWLPNDVYEKIIATNLCGSIRVTKAFLPLVRKSQGRIVIVSSILGRLATFWWGPYCMTKHALEAFTDVLRLEMNQFNVKVCAIEPGNYMAGTRIMGKEGPEYSAREFWDKLDDSVQQDYGKKEMDEWIVKRMDHFMKLSCDDVSPVIDAMTDCIIRKYPKDRYFLASLNDKILAFIFQFTPTYFSDLLNLYFTWNF